MLLWLTACASYPIPNVKFYAEIPFVDCPEGVYVETLTHKRGLVKCEEWKKIRPLMIMLDPEGKKQVFTGWTEGCRWAGKNSGKCNVQLKTVKTTIDKIDAITSQIIKK